MWAKLSNALKPRQDDNNDTGSILQGQHHPNVSTRSLIPDSDAVFPIPSPPSSPSKQGRRSMFKLMSKSSKGDEGDTMPSPFGLSISFPRKVKSHLHLNGNSSQASFARVSTDARPSQDTLRSYQDPLPRTSQDGRRSPMEPNQGLARSILRIPKTPGTGQNVRFFSRDAYKPISSEQSSETNGAPEPSSFAERLQKSGDGTEQTMSLPMPSTGKEATKRPSVTEIFAPASQSPAVDTSKNLKSLMMPMPPPDVTNIFDMSQDRALSPITAGNDMHMPLIDSAAEIEEGTNQAFTSTPYKDSVDKTTYHSMGISDAPEDDQENVQLPVFSPAPLSSVRDHERNHSSSFGRTVFHSLGRSSGSSSEKSRLSDSSSIFRNRARVFPMPDTDIDDSSSVEVVAHPGPIADPPDPFRLNAMTYYTPQTMIPPTPPSKSIHLRASSKEDDIILSLRTQLALQQELCAQYEIDLGARDEVVQTLTARCEKTEKEGERRRGVLRTWKKKVGELEKVCRGLEEEVERGREESWERSVMDEASGEALKCLQRRIETLEREKGEVEKNAQKVLEEKGGLEKVLAKFKEGLMDAKEQIQIGDDAEAVEGLKACLAKQEHADIAERERHRIAEFEWDEERVQLISRRTQLEAFREELAVELAAAQEQLVQKDYEYGVLKGELEAQWKHTELASEQTGEMRKEMDGIREEAEALEKRIGEMAVEWNESESQRAQMENELQEMLSVKTTLESEKYELEEQLREERERNGHLTQVAQDHERHIAGLASESQFATDSISCLEENILQRDAKIADYSQRVTEHEIVGEQLRELIANMEREHTRIIDEQARKPQDTTGSDDMRQQMEKIAREKAETDVVLGTLRERVSVLKDEVERLRRQVHELQQESADKEVKIVQLTKQRSQDKEDMQGLNIALDSKQQELELLKRKLGVKGTAGSTPAQPSKVASRRDSVSAFTTPGISRPPSALSDTSSRGIETPANTTKALTKSARTNSSVAAKSAVGSMGPPPLKHSRVSLGTPTPLNAKPTSALARSSSTKPAATSSAPSIHRRASSATLEQARMKLSASGRKISESPAPSELGEKENVDLPTPAKVKRRASVMPTLA